MKVRPTQVAAAIGAALLLLAGLGGMLHAGWSYWQIYGIGGWRDEVEGLVGVTATMQAMDDYREGHLRLYIFGGESQKRHYIGTNDGPFEIWMQRSYASAGPAQQYSTVRFIEFYNRKMRYMHGNPGKFQRREKVQPGGGGEPPPR